MANEELKEEINKLEKQVKEKEEKEKLKTKLSELKKKSGKGGFWNKFDKTMENLIGK